MPADAGGLDIAGVGIVSARGRGSARTWDALRSGDAWPTPPRSIRSELAARFPVFEVPDAAFHEAPLSLPRGRGRRAMRLARLAAWEALGGAVPAVPPSRTGVVVGATVGGMNHTEDLADAMVRGASDVARRPALRDLPLWNVSADLARRFGFGGPAFAVASACTSGSQAIAIGADLILSGVCDVVLAGGVDCLSRLTYHGFAALGLMSETRCTPFDAGRTGLNLGEAAAFVVLARPGVAASPLARLTGWSSSADGFHATAPRPDGSGVASAIRGAMALAAVTPRDIGWVHAHGTATATNDAVEALAIGNVFGGQAVPVSSTKHLFGHTLGAAGAVSAVAAVLALRHGFVPGNAPITAQDPACALRIVSPGGLVTPLSRVVVSSLGFGGASCALVVSEARR